MKSRVGSHYYVSPELLREEEYSASVDLWGLGHILFQSLTGAHAFDESVDMYSDVCEVTDVTDVTDVTESIDVYSDVCEARVTVVAGVTSVPVVPDVAWCSQL